MEGREAADAEEQKQQQQQQKKLQLSRTICKPLNMAANTAAMPPGFYTRLLHF
jgi:hypothetical protein